MKKQPFFSIIIPTFNEENQVPKLLTDIVQQENRDFEVIIVDGGSSDKTLAVLETFSSSLPLTIIPAHASVFTARNIGARKARGEYLVFLDADIRIDSLFLSLLHGQLVKQQTDFAFCRSVPDNKKWLDHILIFLVMHIIWILAKMGKPLMSAQCLTFKRSVFEQVKGFDETLVHAEDHELVSRAYEAKYTGRMFMKPFHRISFRRFEREGRLKVLGKYTLSTLHVIFKGPIRKPLFSYEMGGKAGSK